MTTTLPISETFTSIQGEGKLTGVPSHFIRTSGCNLRCRWCDTPYASWSPESHTHEITALVQAAANSGVSHVVVTGGEPMMFEGVSTLTRALRDAGLHITIETAGTIWRDVACDLMSISPKLSDSAPREGDPRDPGGVWRERHQARRLDAQVLQKLLDSYADHQLKFVVAGPGDLPEIEQLLASLRGWKAQDVLLMPEGVSPPEAGVRRWLATECVARGWRYCTRLHIDLFGNRRGT